MVLLKSPPVRKVFGDLPLHSNGAPMSMSQMVGKLPVLLLPYPGEERLLYKTRIVSQRNNFSMLYGRISPGTLC